MTDGSVATLSPFARLGRPGVPSPLAVGRAYPPWSDEMEERGEPMLSPDTKDACDISRRGWLRRLTGASKDDGPDVPPCCMAAAAERKLLVDGS